VACVVDCRNAGVVLNKLPANLNVMYDGLLREHAEHSNVPKDLQMLILQSTTHATRPLRLLEVAEMIKVSMSHFDHLSDLKKSKGAGGMCSRLQNKHLEVFRNLQMLILQSTTHATRPLRLLEVAEMIKVTHTPLGRVVAHHTSRSGWQATC
jgi:hypothetical protein